jgi:hypothetical protein
MLCLLALVLPPESPGATAGAAARADDLFTNRAVPQLTIEVSAEGMKTLREYRQVWRQPRPPRVDVRATVREGGAVYTNVALHLKGSFTFQSIDDKPSLTLNFDKFAPGQRFHGLDKIHLNNSVQDPTYISEQLARELFLAAGVPAARAGHARVKLNDRTLGFYVLLEGYNKRFLKRHFKSTKGNLYDGGSGGDITKELEVDSGEEPDNRSDLAALVAAAREKNPAQRLARLQQVLDVDRFLTFAALEVLLQHWDGYCLGPNNYRLFHDAERDKMVFMPHGMDQLLGVGRTPPPSLTPKWNGVVARGLFSLPEGRRLYLERLHQIFTNRFQAEPLLARIDQLAAQVRPYAADGLLSRFTYGRALDGLKARLQQRISEVREQLHKTEIPLSFGKNDLVLLSGWQFRQTGKEEMNGNETSGPERPLLQLQAAGKWSSGSWRKLVLLDAGRYELSAMARVEGLPFGATNSGVLLRVSGERDALVLVTNSSWTPLRFQFDVAGLINAELVCEFRGPSGTGLFDASTLKLRKLPAEKP